MKLGRCFGELVKIEFDTAHFGDFHVVSGDNDQRACFGFDFRDGLAHAACHFLIEARERFIKEHDFGGVDKGARQSHAARFAA